MEKGVFFILLLALPLVLFTFYFFGPRITGFFIGFGEPAGEFEWWNISWHYRFRLEINSTQYNRTNWPVEQEINFTDLLPSGTFDENSIRVFEYSSSGQLLYEVPNQFDKDIGYDGTNNAVGTLIFLVNGTTPANTVRHFVIYYDTVENGIKPATTYSTDLVYDNSTLATNGEFSVNNTYYKLIFDTVRGENTSGFYYAEANPQLYAGLDLPETDKTLEYLQYSNGTNDFMFDLRNKAKFVSVGPIRIVVEQTGNESLWNNPDSITGQAMITKKYIFYKNNTWIKIIQNFTNLDESTITRNSTEAGALAFDASRAWSAYHFGIGTSQSNETNPSDNTWGWASSYPSNGIIGIINVNQTGTNNFWLTSSSSLGRIGIQLNSTDLNPSTSITQETVFYFGGTWNTNFVEDLRDRLFNPVSITSHLPEKWFVEITPSTNATIYNRNETILIKGNVSSGDPYNLTKYMNATFDMGTSSSSDDQTIILSEAEDRVFTGLFNLSNDAELGIWSVNLTAYTNDGEFLNSTTFTFNVTNVFNVTVNVITKKPMVGSIVIAGIYVKNYRQDSWIAGATINCTYDSYEVINKTDFNNGTYSVNFTAPSTEGNYTLNCNATKNGNFGNGSDTFTAEPGVTYLSITAEPSNPIITSVTLYNNDSFIITANSSNLGNGTAYSANITLELLEGWDANRTLEECNDIEKNNYCTKSFNITVPNGTSPGNYYINVTVSWRNPDESISSNKTQVNVTVTSNPKIDVEETEVSSEAGDGIWTIIGNFTVLSIGNDALQDITFSCISGDACNFNVEFIPENISSLPVGSEQSVSINVTIPLGFTAGTYNGTINVTSQNNGFDTFTLEITIPAKTNVSIATSILDYISQNITQQDNETFSFEAYATNIGNGSARFANISLTLPSGWISNSSLEDCGNLTKDSTCSKSFNVTIPKAASPGNYLVNVSVNWTNPDNSLGTNKTSITVTVSSNPLINVSEANVSGSVPDGEEKTLGNFTVLSIGNDALQNINFNCYSGTVCDDFTVEFIPASIPSLAVNSNSSVMVNITVPVGYPAGTYNGTVNISATNDKHKNLTLEVTVPPNRTWDLNPTLCQRSQSPPEGLACEVNVTNFGNIYIDFTVSPEEGNYTKVNETGFRVEAQDYHVFSVTYNVTNVPPQIYNSTFVIDAVQDANPDNKSLVVSLLPYIPPIINITILPNETQQLDNVEIYVNVTDRSGTNINWVKVNITRPNGTLDQFNMFKIYESGNLSTWHLIYPNSTGDTNLRGIYNVTVYAEDNIGNLGVENTTFLIYFKLSTFVATLSDRYYQGDTGSIFYAARDVNDTGVPNVNITFVIKDTLQNITYLVELTSNQDGMISPLPSFFIPSDAPLGYYTLISNSTFYDDVTHKIIRVTKNTTFEVLSRTVTVTGLFADIETAVVWYPPLPGYTTPIIKFGILIYNGEGRPVDPDYINLTVYRPDGFLYFSDSISNMNKQSTGYYTYQRSMLSDTPTGMYLAVVNATQGQFQTLKLKAFRVASGGPYDIWVQLFENEVQQGNYLDFAVKIENKGEVSQDVHLEWWVSNQNGTKFYQESGWVHTPALSNETVTKQAFIYANQPLGTYVLNVKMTYDAVQPPLIANRTFIVITKELIPPNITYPPVTITYPSVEYPPAVLTILPKVTERIAASISITRYSRNISLARGMTKIESIVVKNTGEVELINISAFILGIPVSWFKITPETYRSLLPDNSSVFLIEFNIPKNAEVGEYIANLTVFSGVVTDQKYITITIFRSMEELLQDEILKLKRDLQILEEDIERVKKEGKDVSSVTMYVGEIKTQINLAEENLKNNRTSDALANVENAKNLIMRARSLLEQLEMIKIEKFFAIPSWVIFVIVLIAILVPVVVILLIRRKALPSLRPYIIPLGGVVEKAKEEKSKAELVKEKEKLLRMLDILEKERKEGIISNVAYREMKDSIEKKLAKIEKKLK